MGNVMISERWLDEATAELNHLRTLQKHAREVIGLLDKVGWPIIIEGVTADKMNAAVARLRAAADHGPFGTTTPTLDPEVR